jgi:hypothetical protein
VDGQQDAVKIKSPVSPKAPLAEAAAKDVKSCMVSFTLFARVSPASA